MKFKKPTGSPLKKVLIYGYSGTGKSTFAADYCLKHNLNPVVIDVEDTNRTRLWAEGRVLDLNFSSDTKTFSQIDGVLDELERNKEFDTIIFDGFTTALDWLISNKNGQAKYGDRTLRFQKLLQKMANIGKHVIFIGQIDAKVVWTDEKQSNKSIIRVDSLVDERYYCEANLQKTKFKQTRTKKRTFELIDEALDTEPVKKEVVSNPIHNQCVQIKEMLEKEDKPVNKNSMKAKAMRLFQKGTLPKETRKDIMEYIQKHCPEEL